MRQCARHLGRLGEAMEHAGQRPACLGLRAAQHGHGVVRCAAGVDHQRLGHGLGHRHVHRKPVALPGHVGHAAAVQAVVVQPRLADAHHARQAGQGLQAVFHEFEIVFDFVLLLRQFHITGRIDRGSAHVLHILFLGKRQPDEVFK